MESPLCPGILRLCVGACMVVAPLRGLMWYDVGARAYRGIGPLVNVHMVYFRDLMMHGDTQASLSDLRPDRTNELSPMIILSGIRSLS